MKLLTSQIAKYVFLIPFMVFGLFHFMSGDAMAGMVPIPGGVIWVYLTGAALLAAPIAVFINRYSHLAMVLLGAMLAIFALSIHLPGVLGGDETQAMTSMPMFLKDMSLAGGAWLFADRYKSE